MDEEYWIMSAKATAVLIPLMGEGITEATLVKWLVQVGDPVEKDQPILEVSTDKVDTEIMAPAKGYLLATYADQGDSVPIHETIAYIGESLDIPVEAPQKIKSSASSASVSAPSKAGSMDFSTPTAPSPDQPMNQRSGLRSSPLVRRMARDFNINLAAIAGRGLGGRITKQDMLNFISKMKMDTAEGLASLERSNQQIHTTSLHGQEFLEGVPVRREKMSKMRSLIADHMIRSVQLSPHASTMFEVNLERLVSIRKQTNEAFYAKYGFKLTFTHLLTFITVEVLKGHPALNCSVDGHDILWKDSINMGLATALEGGLIVPVIKQADGMNLQELANKANDLITRARSKQLLPEEVQGGTFSITNPGGFGCVDSNPIINQPQVAILCLGAIVQRAWVLATGKIDVQPIMNIRLTFDHRVVDGAGAAQFLSELKGRIESFSGDNLAL